MNFDLQAVERAKMILTDRGYHSEIRECFPDSNKFQIVVNDPSDATISDRELSAELGVGVLILVNDDFLLID